VREKIVVGGANLAYSELFRAEKPKVSNLVSVGGALVLQKSIREGFGPTVAQAVGKGTAVVGGNAGGILHQIEEGANEFLVSSVDEAAQRIVEFFGARGCGVGWAVQEAS
jgi:glycosyltransferase involved in cell wall biosynthesis